MIEGETPIEYTNTEETEIVTAIHNYYQTGSEAKGFGFNSYLLPIIEQHGQKGYDLLAKHLAKDGPINVQTWILDAGSQWLTADNARYILDMWERDFEVNEHAGILLGLKWDVVKEQIQKRLLSYYQDLTAARQEYLTTIEAKKFEEALKRFDDNYGGLRKLLTLGIASGLAYMAGNDARRAEIQSTIATVSRDDSIKSEIENALIQSLIYADGKSPYRFEYYRPTPRGTALPAEDKDISGIRFPKQPVRTKTALSDMWVKVSGHPLNTDRNFHRDIIREDYQSPDTKHPVPTIIKISDKSTAENERKNFEQFAQWGLPTPKVYEVAEQGIRVEDLTEGGKKVLVMDDFPNLGQALTYATNRTELQQELERYLETLKSNQVNPASLERTIGVVLDEQGNGKLYFADLNHISIK